MGNRRLTAKNRWRTLFGHSVGVQDTVCKKVGELLYGGRDFHFCRREMAGKSCPNFPKLPMPFAKPSSEELDRIANEVLAVLRKQDDHPLARPQAMTFQEIERTAPTIAMPISTRLTAEALAAHADEAPDHAPCPKCQQNWRVTRKKRTVITADGPVDYREPAAHCIACRCDFFPSASAIATRRTSV